MSSLAPTDLKPGQWVHVKSDVWKEGSICRVNRKKREHRYAIETISIYQPGEYGVSHGKWKKYDEISMEHQKATLGWSGSDGVYHEGKRGRGRWTQWGINVYLIPENEAKEWENALQCSTATFKAGRFCGCSSAPEVSSTRAKKFIESQTRPEPSSQEEFFSV